jgi:hypothetical protein
MRRFLLLGALLSMLLIPASSAMAVGGPHHPTGEFAPFDDCPLSQAEVELCLFSESSSGSFTVGSKTVPLVNPVVLQGGVKLHPDFTSTVFAAEDGNTLVPTPQPVPGGLLGVVAPSWWPTWLQSWFNEQINNGLTGVTATVELAAPASSIQLGILNVLIQKGTALGLPVKIKLSNPILGSSCYIGSNSNPVQINFTTGTTSPPPPNEPITGSPGSFTETETMITLTGGRFVNNDFAAPGAHGCGGLLSLFIDPLVNSILGLPAPSGTNTAILEGKILLSPKVLVAASE